MSLLDGILAVLLGLPGTGLRDDPDRADAIATAIDNASGGDPMLAASVLVVGFHESRYLARIQAGQCRPLECDPIMVRGQRRHRARSYWQILASPMVPPRQWRELTGPEPEAVQRAANVAAMLLTEGRRRCRTVEGGIAWYARGRCTWNGAKRRAEMVRRVEQRLRTKEPATQD